MIEIDYLDVFFLVRTPENGHPKVFSFFGCTVDWWTEGGATWRPPSGVVHQMAEREERRSGLGSPEQAWAGQAHGQARCSGGWCATWRFPTGRLRTRGSCGLASAAGAVHENHARAWTGCGTHGGFCLAGSRRRGPWGASCGLCYIRI